MHVLSCDTLDDITFGDNIPVRIVYYFKQGDHVKQSHSNDEVEDSVPRVNWSSASDAQILEYQKLTNLLLGRIAIMSSSNMELTVHTQIIHVGLLHDTGAKCIGVGKCKQNWVIPGWNDHVAERHLNARDCYLIWRNNSKPRHGPEYEDMKLSRALFKVALRDCRRNEELTKADAMVNKLKHNDCAGFWKEVHIVE